MAMAAITEGACRETSKDVVCNDCKRKLLVRDEGRKKKKPTTRMTERILDVS